jgi:hypothetical protein
MHDGVATSILHHDVLLVGGTIQRDENIASKARAGRGKKILT